MVFVWQLFLLFWSIPSDAHTRLHYSSEQIAVCEKYLNEIDEMGSQYITERPFKVWMAVNRARLKDPRKDADPRSYLEVSIPEFTNDVAAYRNEIAKLQTRMRKAMKLGKWDTKERKAGEQVQRLLDQIVERLDELIEAGEVSYAAHLSASIAYTHARGSVLSFLESGNFGLRSRFEAALAQSADKKAFVLKRSTDRSSPLRFSPVGLDIGFVGSKDPNFATPMTDFIYAVPLPAYLHEAMLRDYAEVDNTEFSTDLMWQHDGGHRNNKAISHDYSVLFTHEGNLPRQLRILRDRVRFGLYLYQSIEALPARFGNQVEKILFAIFHENVLREGYRAKNVRFEKRSLLSAMEKDWKAFKIAVRECRFGIGKGISDEAFLALRKFVKNY